MFILKLVIYILLNIVCALLVLLFFGEILIKLEENKVFPYKGWETALLMFCFPLYIILKIIFAHTSYYDLDEEDTKARKLFKEQEKQKKETNRLFNRHNKIIQDEIIRTEDYLKSLKKCKL